MNDMSLKTQFEDSHYDPQYAACRRLWNAIMLAQLQDMIQASNKQRKSMTYRNARSWFGTFPGRDFCEVCENAGHDPQAVWDGAMKINNGSEVDRKAALKRMIAKMGVEE